MRTIAHVAHFVLYGFLFWTLMVATCEVDFGEKGHNMLDGLKPNRIYIVFGLFIQRKFQSCARQTKTYIGTTLSFDSLCIIVPDEGFLCVRAEFNVNSKP